MTDSSTRARKFHGMLRASDMMTSPVVTVHPDTPTKDIAAAMVTYHISGVPVVTAQAELVGIVTEADLLHKEGGPFEQDPRFFAGLPAFARAADAARKASGRVARDLMTSPVITIEEDVPLREVAALMMRRKINRLPVMCAGRLVGIVSRADIIRALVRPDEEIAAAARDVLLQVLWVDISKMRIDVRDGVVYLGGEVERYSEKELAERWVASVDGVVAVESTLTYGFDDRTMRSVRDVHVTRVE